MHFVHPQNTTDAQLVSTAVLIGAMVGQLSFGFVADILGKPLSACLSTCSPSHVQHITSVSCSNAH